MTSVTSRAVLCLLVGGAGCGVAHAARPEFDAGVNITQTSESQLHGPGADEVTYTEVSGTVAGEIHNRRIVASGTYQLDYRIPEIGKIDKSVSQNGVVRVQADVIDEWLTVDSGAIITHSRVDPSGAAPEVDSASNQNLAQTYSIFFEPSLAHRFGDLGTAATYRYAYTTNNSSVGKSTTTGPPTDRFDSSTNQEMTLSLGMTQSALPFGWKVSGAYRMENTTNLAKHTRAANIIGDINVPISATVEIVGSAGYEKTKISERQALIDPLTGAPALTDSGKFIADPASPRILTYDTDGFIGDAGLAWRPSQRSRFELRGGYRYGGVSVTGLAEMKPDKHTSLAVVLTDGIQSFGQSVSAGLAGSGPDLDLAQSSAGSPFQDCLFGKASGGGQCIGGALGQASAKSYRERAINIIVTRNLRRWQVSGSAGYARRTYFDDPTLPFSLADVLDQTFFGDLTLATKLTRTSGVSFSFRGKLFKNGLAGAADVKSGSFSSNYSRSFGRKIQLQANISVDASQEEGSAADVSGRAQVGLQYRF